MVRNVVLLLIVLIAITRTKAVVTNEDIRVAILQIVKVVRATDDKLERHEFRDRAVSEQLKKGLINIDRKIKMLDPLKGTVGRLDERLAAVETILMQKNEGEKMQLQRTYEAVIDIQKNLPVLLEEMKNEIISKITAHEPPAQITEPTITKKDFEKLEKEFINKIDKVSNIIGNIETELPKLKEDSKHVKDIHDKSSDNLEKLKKHIDDNQQLLTKFDKKLSEYNNKIPNISSDKGQDELKQTIAKVLDSQKSTTKDIQEDIKNLQNQVKQLPQKDDITRSQSSILNKLTNGTNYHVPSLEKDISKILVVVNKSHNDTVKNTNVLITVTDTLRKGFANANNALDNQNKHLNEVLQNIKALHNQISKLPQKDAEVKSLRHLEDILNHTRENQENTRQILNNIDTSHRETNQNINGLSEITNVAMKSLANVNNAIDNEKITTNEILQDLRKLENKFVQPENQSSVLIKLEEILNNIRNNPSWNEMKQALNKINDNLNNGQDNIVRNINGVTEVAATLITSVSNTNNAIEQISRNMTRLLNEINQVATEGPCGSKNNISSLKDLHNILVEITNNIARNHGDTTSNLRNLADMASNLINNMATNYTLDNQNKIVNEVLQHVQVLQNKINQLPQKDAELKSINSLEDILNHTQENHREISLILSNINDTKQYFNGLSEIANDLAKSLAKANNVLNNQKTTTDEILQVFRKLQNYDNQSNVLGKLEEILKSVYNNPSVKEMKEALDKVNNNLNISQDNIIRNINGFTEVAATLITSVSDKNNSCNGQKSDVKEIQQNIKYLEEKIDELPHKHDINKTQKKTLQELENLSNKISSCQSDGVKNILEEINKTINRTHADAIEKLNDLSEITSTLGNSFANNYDKIRAEIQNLSGLDQIIIKTADTVIDTKRRVEFAVHNIVAEMTKHSKEDVKHISQSINDRLDIFEQSILDEDSGALANVTSKIESDIQQVWRQIGIMYQQMSSNSEALEHLQNQTDLYVNGSLGTMNNVKGKVGQITNRIIEVDENLNYLLGRLSLVTQEFNRIKTGLTSALDQIRGSFHAVQSKLNKGPGPHPIESEEVPLN
ncbi:extracellular matrix-binding protein ebh isoform X1 [Diorhabda carinulata]|uniref:extracellular matrix-binding protein ebh isoform X1 n=2 Tax=Diorhabda carinulata TaxID=1163345 RepID=UPI0025A0BB6E|nr:extracellular matrix-binding protein ebh isoform X1 [Diorhabda carinulata]XP_057666983.1 extracellular matrix-binding protein ebh isoform X1 [Diorhabda carinulata]XP_057666984.1 extracellular matrix-binding protein ebh isoform X1 [Diorhabda carinulata]